MVSPKPLMVTPKPPIVASRPKASLTPTWPRPTAARTRSVRAGGRAAALAGVLAGALLAVFSPFRGGSPPCAAAEFTGRVVDADSGELLPARIYLQDSQGEWLFVESADPAGSAFAYREQWVPMPDSVERHTTVSPHPFRADLAPGKYQITIERGKEYHPLLGEFEVAERAVQHTFRLKRWINLAARGWYSGETHVHRRIAELPNTMLAENLNVAFPVTFWTTRDDQAPGLEPSPLRRQGPSPFGPRKDRGYQPILVDQQHVIFPRNTEYEIFSVGGRRHVLGALFVLNHRTPFRHTAPPVRPIAEQAHREGALLDLDKHSWPWSLMLVPVAGVDLYELSNNSVWRTNFGFKQIGQPIPEWMAVERAGPQTLTEWGWLNYGFEVYYGLLNCGFRLSPTAGTASGVHPVPLGYSRVYVHLDGNVFSAPQWLAGLKAGHSFVTNGPMLFATVNEKHPGHEFQVDSGAGVTLKLAIESLSARPVTAIEVVVNGQVAHRLEAPGQRTARGAWQVAATREFTLERSSWIAVRSIEPQPDGRKRFAHTAPWFVSVGQQPVRPRREQVEYFVGLMESEISRNRELLAPRALAEFRDALDVYRKLLVTSE